MMKQKKKKETVKKEKGRSRSKGKIAGGRSICFIMNLRDLTPELFDAPKQAAYKKQLAKTLGISEAQVEVRDLAAGSLIVDTKVHGLTDEQAKRMAALIVDDCDKLLDKDMFGKAKVVRGELKEMADSDASDDDGYGSDGDDDDHDDDDKDGGDSDDGSDDSGSIGVGSESGAESVDWTSSESEKSEESEESVDSDEERERVEAAAAAAAEAEAEAEQEAQEQREIDAARAKLAGKPPPLDSDSVAPSSSAPAPKGGGSGGEGGGGGGAGGYGGGDGDDGHPNDLSDILEGLGLEAHYDALHEACGGKGDFASLLGLGEKGIAGAGLPLMRARKVWKQVSATAASRADREPQVDDKEPLMTRATAKGKDDAAAASPSGKGQSEGQKAAARAAVKSPLHGGSNDDDDVPSRKGKLNAMEEYEEMEAKKRRLRAEAAADAAFAAEISGDTYVRARPDTSPMRTAAAPATSPRLVAQPSAAVVAGLEAEWASPAEVEAELIWGRLEGHFDRNQMDVSDFVRHVERVETGGGDVQGGGRIDGDDFARALKRFLRLDLGHATLQAVLALAEAKHATLRFTPLEPPPGFEGHVLEGAPFAPRGYFRRASTFSGAFAG
jgi:hypothetical protein